MREYAGEKSVPLGVGRRSISLGPVRSFVEPQIVYFRPHSMRHYRVYTVEKIFD
jgi:hypothetical protein